jgi:hypothetical protein
MKKKKTARSKREKHDKGYKNKKRHAATTGTTRNDTPRLQAQQETIRRDYRHKRNDTPRLQASEGTTRHDYRHKSARLQALESTTRHDYKHHKDTPQPQAPEGKKIELANCMRNYNLKKWSFDTEKTKFLSEQ